MHDPVPAMGRVRDKAMTPDKMRNVVKATVVPWVANHYSVVYEYDDGSTFTEPVGSKEDAEEVARLARHRARIARGQKEV